MYELEKDGQEISYYTLNGNIIQDVFGVLRTDCDILFFPYIHSRFIWLLLLLKCIGLYKKKICGILHQTPHYSGIRKAFYKFLFQKFSYVFFHSQFNRQECIKDGFVKEEKSSLIYWGVDLDFYQNIYCSAVQDNYIISTGMENRDYNILINISSKQLPQIKLFMPSHSEEANKIDKIIKSNDSNCITSFLVEQTEQTIKYLAKQVADSFAVVIPVKSKFCNYCVGHTTMVEAMALGKPLIVVDNPYHPIDVEKEVLG